MQPASGRTVRWHAEHQHAVRQPGRPPQSWRRCQTLHAQCKAVSMSPRPPLQVFLPAEAATVLAAPAAAMHVLSTELLVYRRTIDQVPSSTCPALLPCALQQNEVACCSHQSRKAKSDNTCCAFCFWIIVGLHMNTSALIVKWCSIRVLTSFYIVAHRIGRGTCGSSA